MSCSPFGDILADVVRAVPEAVGAVFVDWEGETVDQAVSGSGEDLKLLAAHWTIAYYQARTALEKHGLGSTEEFLLRFKRQQILIHRVTDEYLVLLAVDRRADLGRARNLLQLAGARLRGEM